MNVTLLGVGLMGEPMAQRILSAGHRLTVYNRTNSKMKALKEKGAHVAANPINAIHAGEVIILMLTDAYAIEEVLFSQNDLNLKGRVIIQMGTIAPEESIAFQKKVFKCGGEYFECPVLGSIKEVIAGKLILMIGSTGERYEKWKEFLSLFGPAPLFIGEVGKAASLKLAVNQLIACHAISFSTSLGIIRKNEINVEIFSEILRSSSLYAPMFDKKLPLWLNNKYTNPNFPTKHLLKDVRLIKEEVERNDQSVDVLNAIEKSFQDAIDQNLGELDYSSIYKTINKE